MNEESALPATDARYELLGELGFGGMAAVYLGRQRGAHGFTRLVAVKSMHAQFARDESFRAMFLDEAAISGRIRHPNVVPTIDVAASRTKLLLVMEYVEGVPLTDLVRAKHRFPLPIVSAIVGDLLAGLHAAHELTDDEGQSLGVVHRDVSPHNVLLGSDGLARVLDFGIAKAAGRRHHTITGEVKGKMGYMAPEQVFGEAVDRRADVYSAGVVLWELATGRRLFDADNEGALALQISNGRIDPPSRHEPNLPEGFDALVLRALAAKAGARYATAEDMRTKLFALIPPASREEVAAVVKKGGEAALAAHRELVRGKQAQTLAEEPEARAVLDTLTKVRTASDVEKPPSRVGRMAVGALFLLIAGGAAAFALRPQRAPEAAKPLTADTASASSAAPVVAPPAASSVREPVAAPPASAASAAAPSVSVPVPVRSASRHTKSGSATSPPAPATAQPVKPETSVAAPPPTPAPPPSGMRADCNPPFTVDAQGRRHYRVECFQGTQ